MLFEQRLERRHRRQVAAFNGGDQRVQTPPRLRPGTVKTIAEEDDTDANIDIAVHDGFEPEILPAADDSPMPAHSIRLLDQHTVALRRPLEESLERNIRVKHLCEQLVRSERKATLEASRARWKFISIHQLIGGADNNGRGGVEVASFHEWGGLNVDGGSGFAQQRPGWAMPIHQLLIANQVTAVFHGHDHLFIKQELDGIIYQVVPQPSALRSNGTNSAA